MKVPRRNYGAHSDFITQKMGSSSSSSRLPNDVPIIGLGCSSFSNFFSHDDDVIEENDCRVKEEVIELPLNPKNNMIREWINTVREAIRCGINLLDTAPWYGHGISECLIGLALTYEENCDRVHDDGSNLMKLVDIEFERDDIIINTKVGRYDADPNFMFDFSAKRTRSSVLQSIERMKCRYINVIQLHDPEFSPSIEILLDYTIPELCSLRDEGMVKAIGITGYPLEIQHEILVRNFRKSNRFDFDQALTYCHFNFHDQSLFSSKKFSDGKDDLSFFDFCAKNGICVMAAAPLSMGLFTEKGPPKWHPASIKLKESCNKAVNICHNLQLDISNISLLFALSRVEVPCTLIGLRNRAELSRALNIAHRYSDYNNKGSINDVTSSTERRAFYLLEKCFSELSPVEREWDGKLIAHRFWEDLGNREEAIILMKR